MASPGVWWQTLTHERLRELNHRVSNDDNCEAGQCSPTTLFSNIAERLQYSIGNRFSKGSTSRRLSIGKCFSEGTSRRSSTTSTDTTISCGSELPASSTKPTGFVDRIRWHIEKVDQASFSMVPNDDCSAPDANMCRKGLNSLAMSASIHNSAPAEYDQEDEFEDSQSRSRVDVSDEDDNNFSLQHERGNRGCRERLNYEHLQSITLDYRDKPKLKPKQHVSKEVKIANKFMKVKRNVSITNYELKKFIKKKHSKSTVVNNNELINRINRETLITKSLTDSIEAKQINHTLKVVLLGSGNDNISNSLRKDHLYDQEGRRKISKKSSKPGVSLSVKSLSPSDDNWNFMRGNVSSDSGSCSSIAGHKDLRFSLWEMKGLGKDHHHATQSICFSPNSLYIIVYKVPPITYNTDVCNYDDDFSTEDEAVQKSEQELHHHMDEHFFSWVDLLFKRAPKGSAILPVVSSDEDYNYGSDDNEASKWIRDCCDMLKKRILEDSMALPSLSLKIVLHCDDIPVISPSRSDRCTELRHAIYRLASCAVFHRHLHTEITPLLSCVRNILFSYRKEGYSVLPLDDLHVKVVDDFPQIIHSEIIDALKFLSSVGDIIFFTKEEDGKRGTEVSLKYSNQSVLSKFIILEPKWMSAVVSCILRDDWKVIRNNLNDTIHRRGSNVSNLDGCIRNDKSSCPILSPQDSTDIWENASFIKETQDMISKLGSDNLLLFLRQACEHVGIFVPFPIDEASSSFATMSDSSAVRYLLPGLCQEDPQDIWSFKSKETWKTTLCQSWLFKDRVPCGMFDQVMITALEKLGGILNFNQGTQLLCWKTALYAKIFEEEEGNVRIFKFFIHLVRSDSLQCPSSHTLKRGMKLVVSVNGVDTHDCDNSWRLGYRNILDSIETVVNKALVGVEREVSCPGCIANSDPCEANAWKVDNDSVYEHMDPTMRCNSGHRVSTKIIYRSRDNDIDATTVCTACIYASSSAESTYFREDYPGKSIEELLGAVVLVGLWDINNERIVDVGTGFIADISAGFIMTAGHIFYDLKEGSKVGPKYKGIEDAKAVIGIMHDSKEGRTISFTHSAEIMTDNVTNVDAVVLRITTKFENPMLCPSFSLKQQPEVPMFYGKLKYEKTKRLNLTKPRLEEQIRIIGFVQRGEGIYEQGQIINHTPNVTKGYVCNIKDHVSPTVQYGPDIFFPLSEIVVECASYQGQSGGPCINQDGKVIGIVTRRNIDQRMCYLAPSSELVNILKKAKRNLAKK